MAVNDLTTPLGVERTVGAKTPRKSRPAWVDAVLRALARVPVVPALAGLLIAILAGVVLFVALVDDPLGGEPRAVAVIERQPSPVAPDAGDPPAGGAADHPAADHPAAELTLPPPGKAQAPPAEPASPPIATVETSSGVVVVRGGTPPAAGSRPGSATSDSPPPGGLSIAVPAPKAVVARPPAPPKAALMERGREGALPKIGPDGSRPADVYARQVAIPPSLSGKTPPRIAVLVGGLGISQSSTGEAVARLPGAVTLAFAPYGLDLDRMVAQARGAGHEIMLQTPMEPFDYPDNDPGPQTLLTGQSADQNLDRLRWQMGRFAGYVGITNYMGARFTADAGALTPVLHEIGARGLIFADDGSSPRSLVGSLARGAGLPATTADLVIDANPTAESIDIALQRLEQIAATKGTAFGVATGMPLTIRHIADWAAALERRGLFLVPVSALINR